jgi:hypothetical protein
MLLGEISLRHLVKRSMFSRSDKFTTPLLQEIRQLELKKEPKLQRNGLSNGGLNRGELVYMSHITLETARARWPDAIAAFASSLPHIASGTNIRFNASGLFFYPSKLSVSAYVDLTNPMLYALVDRRVRNWAHWRKLRNDFTEVEIEEQIKDSIHNDPHCYATWNAEMKIWTRFTTSVRSSPKRPPRLFENEFGPVQADEKLTKKRLAWAKRQLANVENVNPRRLEEIFLTAERRALAAVDDREAQLWMKVAESALNRWRALSNEIVG